MNVSNIVKRIGDKADQIEVNEGFQQQTARVDQLERTFISIIDEVEALNRQGLENRRRLEELFGL